jgi:hypothetical protein
MRIEEIKLTFSTLFLIAAIQYTYITYLGYNALPFIARSEILLAPLLPLFVGYVSSLFLASSPSTLYELCSFSPKPSTDTLYLAQPWSPYTIYIWSNVL